MVVKRFVILLIIFVKVIIIKIFYVNKIENVGMSNENYVKS